MLIGFILGIIVMSILATIGFLLYDKGVEDGILLLGPAMWIFYGIFLILEVVVKIFKGRKLTKYTFEEIKKR